jgi:hypothetical protein
MFEPYLISFYMSEFWVYVTVGLKHVLDIDGYDHVLFLIALTVPYGFKEWKRVLWLVTLFTLGHTLSLMLSVFEWVNVKASLIEFLIPITILITALYHLFTAGKKQLKSLSIVSGITLFFGLIHGLGFSNYFKSILPGSPSEKVIPLLQFALGIEIAQIIVVLVVMILAYLMQMLFRFSQRDWTLVATAFVIGVLVPMLMESKL